MHAPSVIHLFDTVLSDSCPSVWSAKPSAPAFVIPAEAGIWSRHSQTSRERPNQDPIGILKRAAELIAEITRKPNAACSYPNHSRIHFRPSPPGASSTPAHRNAEAKLAIWNMRIGISTMPATSGTAALSGPKKRPMTIAQTP